MTPKTAIAGPLLAGAAILTFGCGGMVAWAALAPLHSAVIAPGVLVPETGRKTIKHTEGGTIAEVFVAEGDHVHAGQVLLRLDTTEAEARLGVLTIDYRNALAADARLQAELFDRPTIDWPAKLTALAGAADVERLMQNQQKLFDVRRTEGATEQALIQERVKTLEEEVASTEEQRKFLLTEIKINEEEIAATEHLYQNGNATKTRLLDLEKTAAQLLERDRDLTTHIAQSRQQGIEAKAELLRHQQDRREKVLTELQQVRADLGHLADQTRDATNKLATRDITAPEDGIVVGLSHLAPGVVISPGEAVLDLVPSEQQLLVEARVTPKDIASVQAGMPSRVTLTAYDSRRVGTLEGTVEQVSADRLTDQTTHQPYYMTRIRLKDATAHMVGKLRIVPGMPVEAHILIAARTPLDYIISPLTRSYAKAFVQQ